MHGLLHLPHELAQPGKMGDILKSLLQKRGHYVALVSRMEDSLAEEPMVNGTGRDGTGRGETGQAPLLLLWHCGG